MADGQVVFEISGDNRGIRQTLNETTTEIERAGRAWDRSVDDSAANMSAAFGRALDVNRIKDFALKAGKAILDFGMEAVQAASDLAEVQNVVDVTFGDGASKIEKWAKAAGEQFGLTETQAKKFTSTLGAMMKSAGLAGPEIVNMSTDLAGLAADMASFYNLDFDTAFQKIRSGISGETEPLKQLGINMSVANLEAFALTKGITKAFNKMSQSEQIMLRYQYLMQATADAQGDFARTSDGYANGLRAFETNIESLKTSIGTVLLPIINTAITNINGLVAAMTQTKPRTVLDDFADIDLKTDAKLAQIEQTADEAGVLIDTLKGVASAAKELKISSTSTWEDFLDMLASKGSIDFTVTGKSIEELAAALDGNDPNTDRAQAWKELLDVLASDVDGIAKLTGLSSEDTVAWLNELAASANSLDPNSAEGWDSLFDSLIDGLSGGKIQAGTVPDTLTNIAAEAGKLKPSTAGTWRSFLTALSAGGNIDFTKTGKSIDELAAALEGNDPNTDRAQAWKELLSALSSDVKGLSDLNGSSAEDTSEFLKKLAEGANSLDPSSAEGWDALATALMSGFNGDALEDNAVAALLALGTGSEEASKKLQALGYSTDDIDQLQKEWVETCKRLAGVLPGLSSLINTETGEINGGVDAIDNYVKAWKEGQEKLILWEAYYAKERAVLNGKSDVNGLRIDAMGAEYAARNARKKLDELRETYGLGNFEGFLDYTNAEGFGLKKEQVDEYNRQVNSLDDAETKAAKSAADYKRAADAADAAMVELENDKAALVEQYGEEKRAADDAAGSTVEWSQTQKDAAETALKSAVTALQDLEQYYARVRSATRGGIDSTVSGFKGIETPAEQARNTVSDLTGEIKKLNAAGKDTDGLKIQRSAINDSIPTIENMNAGLKDQIAFLEQYQKNLANARAKGVREDILATLADGSVESADYLQALADADTDSIEQLNDNWKAVQAAKDELTTTLTDTKLGVDAEFQGLVDAAQAAAEGLDVYATAESSMEHTVQGIADGIAAQIPTVEGQVDALNGVLARLGNIGGATGEYLNTTFHLNGSHALGLDYVPFDNYLAQLHEGESILTAEEARVWRAFKSGGASTANTIDYEAMGDIMRDNMRTGGNVYLDGHVVGRLISEQQGNSLRNLERSGWQG